MRSGTYWTVCLSVIRFAKLKSIYIDPETTYLLKTDTSDFSVVKCTELKGLRGVYPKIRTDWNILNMSSISSRDKTLFQVWLKALHLGSPAPGPNTEPHHAMRASSRAHAKARPTNPINLHENSGLASSTARRAHCDPVHVSARSEPVLSSC